MAPLVLLIVVLGVFPKPMLVVIEPAIQATMQHVGVTDPQPTGQRGGRPMMTAADADAAGDHRAHHRVRAAAAVHPDLRRAPASACWSRRSPPRSAAASAAAGRSPLSPSLARAGHRRCCNWAIRRQRDHRRRLGRPRRTDVLHVDDPAGLLGGISFLVFAERKIEGGVSVFAPQAAAVPGTAAEREAIAARVEHTEVFPLALFALSGMMLFPASNDLITMFVALEILSLPLYLLCGLARRRRLLSQEAALKYFLLGALSSAFFVYGAALLYGYSGSFTLAAIDAALRSRHPGPRACCSPAWGCSASGCCSSSAPCRSTPGPRTSTRARRRRSPASWRPAPRSPPSAP